MFKHWNCPNIISTINKDENGLSGLETAIILIAFVTVAAVFSYAVLSAGLFSADREKENLHAALNEVRNNLELSGSVVAISDSEMTTVNKIIFCVKNAVAGHPMDLTPCDGTAQAANNCVITLVTADSYINNVKWSKEAIGATDLDNLLEAGEQFEITIDLNDLGESKYLTENITMNSTFDIHLKPSIGSTITVERTVPAAIQPIMDLH